MYGLILIMEVSSIIIKSAYLMDLIERVQYKAVLIVSGCWQGTSRVKLYDKLGWESLSDRRWARRMTTFYKVLNGMAPSYLLDHISKKITPNVSLCSNITRPPFSRTERYDNSFFHFVSTARTITTIPSNLCLLRMNLK